MKIRVGQGWDRHILVKGRPCILGGILFEECPVGPLGHSDGDALAHALIDALLGAAGLGDIGGLFPDTDPEWAGADSMDLLARSWELVQGKSYKIENVDCTIITEVPKITPRAEAMKEKLASVLGVEASQVSIKATRGEGVGPEGRGECITAMVSVLLTTGLD